MDLLIKLKEGLAQLNKKNVPKRLQKGVISCTNECEGVIQKVKMEKSEIERQLESSSARIEELTSELAFYRSAIYGKGIIILFILPLHDNVLGMYFYRYAAPTSLTVNFKG